MKNKKTVAVVGLGYVGLPLAVLAARKGYRVIGIDVDTEKISLITRGKPPFRDSQLARELKSVGLIPTTDFSRVSEAKFIVICVPTPVYPNRLPNLEPVENACRSVAPHLSEGHVVILESTVNPGVCESVVLPILEKGSELVGGKDFHLAHCPERINPGDRKWNVENIPRVIGSLDEKGLTLAKTFYESIIEAKIKQMGTLKEAEAVKIVENSFRDVNIAFVNELAQSFSKLGINVLNVIEGASTKPFAFLAHFPGCGVGGHCIPVDPYYLIDYAKKNGYKHRFLALARKINEEMPRFTADLVAQGLRERNIDLTGKKVVVLGLAYKRGIDDTRESPSFQIVKHLQSMGAIVSTYDPYALSISTDQSLDKALKGASAAVVATDHREFSRLSPDIFVQNRIGVVVDGRNCLKENLFVGSGILYKSIGR